MRTIPLSPQQRGLYFMHRLAPASPVYHVPVVLRVIGELERDRLQRAVSLLQQRHESLRSTVSLAGQTIHDDPAPVTVKWWTTESAESLAAQPFELELGPLWRVDCITASPGETVLVLTFHHLIVDETSVALLGSELGIAYGDPAALTPTGPSLPTSAPEVSGLDYWRKQLDSVADLPLSPLDRHTFTGDRVSFEVDETLLRKVCREHRVTPFMVFYAAFAVLLQRWTGRDKVGIGTPVPGPASDAVGYFQNIVVLATAISRDATFAEVLKLARHTVLEALQHQATPFESVVEALRPRRSGTRNPLFQAALVYNRQRLEEGWELPGLKVEPLDYPWNTAHFDLTLAVTNAAGPMHGELNYSNAILSRGDATLLGTSLGALLDEVLHRPSVSVGAISIGDLPAIADTPVTATDAGAGVLTHLLMRLFRDLLEVAKVEPQDDFFALGGHSLLAVRLVAQLREELGRAVSVGDFMRHPTPASFARRLAADQPTMPTGLVSLRNGDCDTTIVLVHPMGGTLFCFADLIAELPPSTRVVGFERITGAHPADETLEALATRYIEALDQAGMSRLVIVGWSLGGVIAQAMAAKLSAHLVLLDSLLMCEPLDRDRLAAGGDQLRGLAKRILDEGSFIVDEMEDQLCPLGVDIPALRQTPATQAAEMLGDWADLLTLVARHEPHPSAESAQLFAGADNPSGYPEAMAASWAGLCAELATEQLPGDHFGILRPPAATRIAAYLAQR